MLNVFKKVVTLLQSDPTLNSLMQPSNSSSSGVFVGPVDIVNEQQTTLLMPMLNVWLVSESIRTVPRGARDITVQVDIWSRNSQLELENLYERLLTVLDFLTTDQGPSHIYWDRLQNAVDMYESDRRIWHKACRFTFWADG